MEEGQEDRHGLKVGISENQDRMFRGHLIFQDIGVCLFFVHH